MASLILTLVGPDRPGLVSRISEQVAARGGSWLESRMAHLAGQFAGIVLVRVPDIERERLADDLAALRVEGLQVSLHEALSSDTPGQDAPGGAPPMQPAYVLELVCQDRPGILREVTRVLASSGVNIEELTTRILSGSFSGESLFRCEARLRIPAAGEIETLRGELERLGNDLMVDLRLTEPPG